MLSIAMYVMCRHAASSVANWKTKDMSKLETARYAIAWWAILAAGTECITSHHNAPDSCY
jgi:hypothetical protein